MARDNFRWCELKPVYNGHPSGPNQLATLTMPTTAEDNFQWNLFKMVTQPSDCYTEVTRFNFCGVLNQLAAMER